MRCIMVRIYGRVQGVWYRDSTRSKAEELGVAGWVRNRSDGSVEAQFHGSEAALQAMVTWCRQGPPLAHVEKVESQPCPEGIPSPSGFVVRR